MDLWSSQDAANRLGLSARRVRALARAGRLKAHKIGSRWILEPVSAAREPRAGRPVSASIGWAILALLSGARPAGLHPSALSRLKRRLRDLEWVLRSLQYGEARARVVRWRVLPADIPKILAEYGLVLTGLSAITEEIDLLPSSGEVDAYVTSAVIRKIERQFQPAKEAGQPNLTLRVPNQPWILAFSRAPLAVVSADLLLSPDARAVRAGRDALRRLVHD
jgi:excisionase family DNA binding protein